MKICTICARGGSKGVLNKNIRLMNGIPLIVYSINQAIQSKEFEVVAVSSDSSDILEIASQAGVKCLIKRPEVMAQDSSAKLPAIIHAMEMAENFAKKKSNILVDLDCTSPLRAIDDIKNAIKLLEQTNAPNVITGAVARRSPYFNLVEMNDDETVQLSKVANPPIVRRQDAPKCFDMNASIYVWRREEIYKSPSVINSGTRLYCMPEERSIDIDSELDFSFVEFLMKNAQG
ncbi:MAG: acylneuraminate cytidylyltransferase family protein [Bacteriovoracaceae bacterium]|nr:acylneuraminate cytidylyltransferase family protein [Bacteriovoracaceae bacterium]